MILFNSENVIITQPLFRATICS